jgi:hypothetical protein
MAGPLYVVCALYIDIPIDMGRLKFFSTTVGCHLAIGSFASGQIK